MPKEIERKFLVNPELLPVLENPHVIRQGYIPTQGTATVRIRISNNKAFLTLKGRATGLTRSEFEYPVPLEDAEKMLQELCVPPLIEKKRYLILYRGHTWELDLFEGDNAGLIVAEIELDDENEAFEKPPWVSQEVSFDPRYRNANLITHPYSRW
ncbi:adenylate cyclase [Sulfurovum lithotrophicum]|uniref:Adenylate cyclase n=1 Tax=Sulfurovum lithotrophicum TaxID=206403 RepID=A0A7U4RQP4_9BACT|nr:CYTH domain-containing protein [Sulfurovum lithotrophicum]AKF24952.1 adenylate cyclase [Sulfurovum lithotrophicum]